MTNRWLTVAAVAAGMLGASQAWALPALPKYVQENYEGKPAYSQFSKMYSESKTKCALCHIPGADKKAKGHGLNDFGKEMHDHLDDDEFKKLDKSGKTVAADHEKALKLVAEALEKSEAAKDAGGNAYGDAIRKGEFPVK